MCQIESNKYIIIYPNGLPHSQNASKMALNVRLVRRIHE